MTRALSPQTLTEIDRRLVAAWAADCAERVLPVFETDVSNDDRVRDAIERARAFARGELTAAGQIKRRFVAGRAAHVATQPAAAAAARSAAQAAGVAHMGAHALGAAAYAVKAVTLSNPDSPRGRKEFQWQLGRLSPEQAAALKRLPLLGENPSGPLGSGLLVTGALGATVREIQSALETTDRGAQ
ncbi:MAG: putative immunity protein [Rhodoglobus sp.]